MKVRCVCRNLMHDEDLNSCDIYGTYLDEDYYKLLQSNPKTIDEMVDNMPSSGPFWKCRQCGRLLFFKKSKIEFYKLEKEVMNDKFTG